MPIAKCKISNARHFHFHISSIREHEKKAEHNAYEKETQQTESEVSKISVEVGGNLQPQHDRDVIKIVIGSNRTICT